MVDYYLRCFSEKFGDNNFLPKFKNPSLPENRKKIAEFFSENYEKIEKIYDCKFKSDFKKYVDPENLDEFSEDTAGWLGLFFGDILNPENFNRNILDFEEENFGNEGWWIIKN